MSASSPWPPGGPVQDHFTLSVPPGDDRDTDVGRDGALTGPNLALYREAVRRYPTIQWQASGGVRDARDLHALSEIGAAAAISGKALLEELIPREDLQPFLPNA